MNKTNFYKEDGELAWLGSRAFYEDAHYGRALTQKELSEREKLQAEYADEIMLAEAMLKDNPSFQNLSLENKINLATNLILNLREVNLSEKKKK